MQNWTFLELNIWPIIVINYKKKILSVAELLFTTITV